MGWKVTRSPKSRQWGLALLAADLFCNRIIVAKVQKARFALKGSASWRGFAEIWRGSFVAKSAKTRF